MSVQALRIFKISVLATCTSLASCENMKLPLGKHTNTTYRINLNGAHSDLANGGNGGYFEVEKTKLGSGSLLITETRSEIDTTAHLPNVNIKLGPNPAIININSNITTSPESEPENGEPYTLDDKLYISDGNGILGDEGQRTGLHIKPGVTLTAQSGLWLSVGNDIYNEGNLVTAVEGSTIYMYADNYWGNKNSTIILSGLNEGGSASSLYVHLNGLFYNQGKIFSNGKNSSSTDGGDAGYVHIETADNIYNLGDICTVGGNALSGKNGGNSRYIRLIAEGNVFNGGDLTIQPGSGIKSRRQNSDDNGADGDGDGDDSQISFPSEDITIKGDSVINIGDLNANGADSTIFEEIYNTGINGGYISLSARGNSLINTGDLTANGGNSTSNESSYKGGYGGIITLSINGNDNSTDDEGLHLTGNINANGGLPSLHGDGGGGGELYIYSPAEDYNSNANWILSSYTRISVDGGDGGESSTSNDGGDGGDGGEIYIFSEHMNPAPSYFVNIEINSELGLDGGTGVDGGDGGVLYVISNPKHGDLFKPDATLNMISNIYARGGNAENTGGNGSTYLYFNSGGQLNLCSNIYLTGGSAPDGINAKGGHGGYIDSELNALDFRGNIYANGGSGDHLGGNGGDLDFSAINTMSMIGNIDLFGGNANTDISDSISGNGGELLLSINDDGSTVQHNNLTVDISAGIAETTGNFGCFKIDGTAINGCD